MPLPFDQHSRTDDITRAVARLVADGGMERVTMRAVAAGVRLSLGSLTNHLTTRERMLRVCGHTFIGWRQTSLLRGMELRGIVAMIPTDEEALTLTRVELAWRELARRDANVAHTVGRYDAALRHAIGRALDDSSNEGGSNEGGSSNEGRTTDEAVRIAVLATVLGLWDALCRPDGHAMPVEQAQLALAAAASAFARSSPTIASGSAAE